MNCIKHHNAKAALAPPRRTKGDEMVLVGTDVSFKGSTIEGRN